MKVFQSDGVFKATRVTGPKHNYLGLRLSDKDSGLRLTKTSLDEFDDGVRIDPTELTNAVMTVVDEVAAKSGLSLHVTELEYVPTDTADLGAYRELARAIVEFAIEAARSGRSLDG